MNGATPAALLGRFTLFRDPQPVRVATFAEDVRSGLGTSPYTLPPKHFYDDLGSALFEAICRLPEYYLTRVERDLLATYSRQIVAELRGPLELVELGSGSAIKTRLLIEALLARQPELTFHPVDISPEALIESSHALLGAHEELRINAYVGDYFDVLRAKRLRTRERVLALFLGSNVGNFEPPQARALFGLLGASLEPGDAVLIGYDLKKDASVLELAYNDPTGVTAAFNKNLLARINRELGGDFDLNAFSFHARYDAEAGAVRSYLRAERPQRVAIPGAGITVGFDAGQTIHTESSYKFDQAEMIALLAACGFGERRSFVDAGGRYALSLCVVT